MSIVFLLVIIAVVGVTAWALIKFVPMPAPIQTVIVVVAVIACILYALHAIGIGIPNPIVPKI